MILEDKGFRLEQIEDGSPFWDLYVNKKVSHKDGTVTQEWKIMQYGVPITAALNSIILCRVAARNQEPINFATFFEAYAKEREEVVKAFNLQTVRLTNELVKLKKDISNGN